VFPDGRVELIVHYGDRFHQVDGAGLGPQPRGLLVGQMTRAVCLREGARVGVIGARIRPAAVGVLFRTAAYTLTGRIVELRDVAGADSDDLVDPIRSAASTGERVRILERFLDTRVRRAAAPDLRAASAASLIEESGGRIRIDRVAGVVALSPRQLQRRFLESIGLAPKQYARVIRFQRALGLLERGVSASTVAHACGYYDQPHFNREFLGIAGMPPSSFGRDAGPLSTHFIHDPSDSYKPAAGPLR
jgi:AraC-like DNA-binding protein